MLKRGYLQVSISPKYSFASNFDGLGGRFAKRSNGKASGKKPVPEFGFGKSKYADIWGYGIGPNRPIGPYRAQ